MIGIGICGIGGRMGRRLASLVAASADLRLSSCSESTGHELLGEDASVVLGGQQTGIRITDDADALAAAADVVVDFTLPRGTLTAAAACAAAGTPMVVGTTGFTDAELREFRASVAPIACVFAPNYSTAMNLLFKLVRDAARILGDEYDVEIVEAHHRHKVDAPSGTALRLAEKAAEGLSRHLPDVAVHGREGIVGARTREEIGIHAIRAGDLVGDHLVMYGADGECLELRHRATSRDAFARGALRAARFARAAAAGFYSMWDVLGIS